MTVAKREREEKQVLEREMEEKTSGKKTVRALGVSEVTNSVKKYHSREICTNKRTNGNKKQD